MQVYVFSLKTIFWFKVLHLPPALIFWAENAISGISVKTKATKSPLETLALIRILEG